MNSTQLEFVASDAGSGQNAKVLEYLTALKGHWVPLPELVEVAGGYAIHSRANDLRKKGFNVENMVDRSSKPYKSFYRLT